MHKITNIDELGTVYTVTDRNGKILQSIQVITHDEILEAALGPWEEGDSITEYLKNSTAVLDGFDALELHTTLWFATDDESCKLTSVFEYAIKHGYDRVILEFLEPVDDNGMIVLDNLLSNE